MDEILEETFRDLEILRQERLAKSIVNDSKVAITQTDVQTEEFTEDAKTEEFTKDAQTQTKEFTKDAQTQEFRQEVKNSSDKDISSTKVENTISYEPNPNYFKPKDRFLDTFKSDELRPVNRNAEEVFETKEPKVGLNLESKDYKHEPITRVNSTNFSEYIKERDLKEVELKKAHQAELEQYEYNVKKYQQEVLEKEKAVFRNKEQMIDNYEAQLVLMEKEINKARHESKVYQSMLKNIIESSNSISSSGSKKG